MTYQAKIDQLLSYSIHQSLAFIEVVRKNPNHFSPNHMRARAAWEQAENAYSLLVDKIAASQINPQELVPDYTGGAERLS